MVKLKIMLKDRKAGHKVEKKNVLYHFFTGSGVG